jgi:hypothetical protein
VANPGEESDRAPLLELPRMLSVLFVDDDLMLRKLFARAVRKVVSETGNRRSGLSTSRPMT